MTVAGLVLAAGGGSRYVGPTHKLLAPFGGRPLVATTLEAAAAAGLDALAAVTGAVDFADVAPPGIVLLTNPRWQEGLTTSLRIGLAWCRAEGHDAVIIGLGDTPGIPSSAWRALAAAKAPVAVASFGGQLRPPVRLEASEFDKVPTSGDVGARALWQSPGTLVVECEGDPGDIDTVEDLAAVELAVARRGRSRTSPQ
jgi:molybdenum cofactor cytidylyltransferase